MAGTDPMSPNLRPIATRTRGDGPAPGPADLDVEGRPSSSGVATPKGRSDPQSESPTMGSDSSSPWRRFFRGGSRYPGSEEDSFSNSPRNLMGFSPRAGGGGSSASGRCEAWGP